MNQIEKFPLNSMEIKQEQISKLKQLFPEVFTEGDKIDWEKLKSTLGENIDVGKERFGLNWAGKSNCFKLIQQPSTGTLIPAKEESINFDTTENLFIEGDNLEVLKLLQKAYFGKVKMIYIDPPYNTGNDFVYSDDYKDNLKNYLEITGQVDSEGKKLSTNVESDGRFHSNWLNMMYPRLFLARNLLKEDGVIFISIDDNEVHNLRALCNEIFGEENFVGTVIWKSKFGAGAVPKGVIVLHEYVFVYARNYEILRRLTIPITENTLKMYNLKDDKFETRGYYGTWPLETTSLGERPNLRFPISWEGNEIWPKKQWLWSRDRVEQALRNDELVIKENKNGGYHVRYKKYLLDESGTKKQSIPLSTIENIYTQDGTKELTELGLNGIFDFPKPAKLLKHFFDFRINELVEMNDIILDFFAGSCSTAQAVLELNGRDKLNKKFICVQIPEPTDETSEAYKLGYKNIAEIGKERIKRVIRKIREEEEKQDPGLFNEENKPFDLGFKVFKLQPSNFSTWDPNVEKSVDALSEQLFRHVDHLSPDAAQEAILFELLLKAGFELTTEITKLTLAGKTVFSIMDNTMLICLERTLTNEVLKAIAELKPAQFICLDEGFRDNDQLKSNAVLLMKQNGVQKFQTV